MLLLQAHVCSGRHTSCAPHAQVPCGSCCPRTYLSLARTRARLKSPSPLLWLPCLCHSVVTLVPLCASEMPSSTSRPFLVLPSLCFKSPGGRVAFYHLVPGPSALRLSSQHGASSSCCPCSWSAAHPFILASQRVTQCETNARRSPNAE